MVTSTENAVFYVDRLLPALPQEVFDTLINPDSLGA